MTTISNFVQVELRTAISDTDDTIRFRDPVAPANAPPDPAGQTAYAVLIDSLSAPTKFEIVTYTRMTFNRLRNVQRGQDGTTAQSWPEGAVIAQDIPADLAEQIGIQAPEPFTDLLELLARRGTVTNSGGTIINAQGFIEEVPDNTPRFSYDANGEIYLLPEEARTNFAVQSEDLTDAAYRVSRATVVAGTQETPRGVGTMQLVQEDTSFGAHGIDQNGIGSYVSGDIVGFSVWAIARPRNVRLRLGGAAFGGSTHRVNFDLTAGTGTVVVGSPSFDLEDWGGGLYRLKIWATATATGSADSRAFLLDGVTRDYTGDGASGVELWGWQVEKGIPFSYIPTQASTVTRTADDYLIDGIPFSDFWNAAEGTIVAEWDAPRPSSGNTIIISSGGSAANKVAVFFSSTGVFARGGNNSYAWTAGLSNANEKVRAAYGFDSAGLELSIDGGATVSGSTNTTGTVTSLKIGSQSSGAGDFTNGKIYRLDYYPKRLPDAEVERRSNQSFDPGDGKRKALKIGPDGKLVAKTVTWSEIAGVPADTPVMILERNDNPRGAWPDEANLYYGTDGGGILGLHMVFPNGVIKTLATR